MVEPAQEGPHLVSTETRLNCFGWNFVLVASSKLINSFFLNFVIACFIVCSAKIVLPSV